MKKETKIVKSPRQQQSVKRSFGQDLQTQLKENAVNIEHLDKLENSVYDKLIDFRLIMIGEMHGTNEPANFLIGLTELFAKNGDTVQVGFEIPSELMTTYYRLLTDRSVFQSDFFTNNTVVMPITERKAANRYAQC